MCILTITNGKEITMNENKLIAKISKSSQQRIVIVPKRYHDTFKLNDFVLMKKIDLSHNEKRGKNSEDIKA